MPTTDRVALTVHDLGRDGFSHTFGKPQVTPRQNPAWHALRRTGTRLWLDTGDIVPRQPN